MVHREHNHERLHLNQHHNLHRRQSSPSVTEVTATVPVVQQVNVDTNGNTIGVETVYADPTATGDVPTGLTVVDASGNPIGTATSTTSSTSSAVTSPSPSPVTASLTGGSLSSTGTSSISTSSQSNQSSVLTSTPLSTTASPSLGGNSTRSALSSGSLFSNSTTLVLSNSTSSTISLSTNSSRTSVTSLTSSSSSSSSTTFLSISSSSSSEFLASSSTTSSITGSGSGTAGSASNTPTNTAGSGATGSNSDDSSNTPSGGVIAGGVVGGVAGLAVLIILALMLLRWKRKHSTLLPLGSEPQGTTDRAVGGNTDAGNTASPQSPTNPPMAERSFPFAIPAALASLTGHKRKSEQPSIAASSTAGSERGFYRVSGRKITSVLESGGDGYGTNDAPNQAGNTLSGSSFYRDSHGFYGGSGTPAMSGPLSSPLGGFAAGAGMSTTERESVQPVPRPSPARTPIIQEGPFASPPSPVEAPPPIRPDALGRSHPSRDGSKGSRFTEEM